MTASKKPFSVREGFAPQALHMNSMEVMNRIWCAIYEIIPFDDALEALSGVFIVPAGDIIALRNSTRPRPLSQMEAIERIASMGGNPFAQMGRVEEQRQNVARAWEEAREWLERCWKHANSHKMWFKFYDLCEFLIANSSQGREIANTIEGALSRMHNAGCRLVDGKFIPGLSREESEEIRKAHSGHFVESRMHMKKALALFSSREKPDYANTVKESVSAVESLVKEWTGKEFKSGMAQLAKDGILPNDRAPKGKPFLPEAVSNIWGYANKTSRHGLKSGESPPDADTARFILVTCAAFVNYMTARREKAE